MVIFSEMDGINKPFFKRLDQIEEAHLAWNEDIG
jgi:hypothetical protein